MRAALALPTEPGAADFRSAAARICRAMSVAREPLQLIEVPEERRVVTAPREWHAGDPGNADGSLWEQRDSHA